VFGDSAADPVKLFEHGQNAHAHGDLVKALEFYEEAIKVRPEFPEAEFQRGIVLVACGRLAEAESGFRRAIELRRDWASPYSALTMVTSNRQSRISKQRNESSRGTRTSFRGLLQPTNAPVSRRKHDVSRKEPD